MSNLFLDSLTVRGYRCFEHLAIEKLGRVNLIVGKNNIGKSSVLEALWLYCQKGSSDLIVDILAARDESAPLRDRTFSFRPDNDLKSNVWNLRHLFYGRTDLRLGGQHLEIGSPVQPSSILSLDVVWKDPATNKAVSDPATVMNAQAFIRTRVGGKMLNLTKLDEIIYRQPNTRVEARQSLYVKSVGLEGSSMSDLWDRITLTDSEYSVLNALRLISTNLKRVNVIGGLDVGQNRIPKVVVEGFEEPIALRSMGEGMNRLFGITLALVNCSGGALMIDEIESGLHYSVLTDIWRLIFRTARELNVQVFATTHSSDCVQAFERAAEEDKQEEGILLRLEKQGEKIVARVIDERLLGIATKSEIEVR